MAYCSLPNPVLSVGDLSLIKIQGCSLQGTHIQLSATVSDQVSKDMIDALKKIKNSRGRWGQWL